MRLAKISLRAFCCCVACLLVGTAAAGAETARGPTEWRMASAFPGSAVQLGTSGRRFAETVSALSGNAFAIRFVEPKTGDRPSALFDRVSRGQLTAAWTTPAYWLEKDPAFALFSSVPFGPSAPEYIAWMYYGGGAALRDELYEPYGLVSLVCGAMAPEAGGWYRREIRSVKDFEGLKMRTFGLGAQVLELFGIEPQRVSADNLLSSLRNGSLDAVEFSMPAIDVGIGFADAGPLHYYFPGWHQQTTLFEFLVGRPAWLSLTEAQRRQVRTACGDNVMHGIAEGEAIQARAILEIQRKGVRVKRFPPEVLSGLEKAWHEIAAIHSTKSKNFERIWASMTRFRKEYRVWRDLGYVR